MQESLVQWTLLNNLDFLRRRIDFNIALKVGQEINTDFGRVDFILQNNEGNNLVVELETILNRHKLKYCFNQVLNYKKIKIFSPAQYCILYAEETPSLNQKELYKFGIENDVIIKKYSLLDVQRLYPITVAKLSKSFGLALPQPKNYTICYLRWLNKILYPFKELKKLELSLEKLYSFFQSRTNFNCYLRLALDFEMIVKKEKAYLLTEYGIEYLRNLNPLILGNTNLSSMELTNEQKRLLLKILTDGIWTVHKVNIFWFLRFIEITGGSWLPKRKDFDRNKLELVNGLFGVSYKNRSMYEFLNFACNWCEELGLVERIKSTTYYDRLYLTPLGIEISNIFNIDIELKKTRLNLSFKYL